MNRLLLTGIAIAVAAVCTPASAKEKGAAAKAALCRADCRPGNYQASGIGMHGLYRAYDKFDPQLVSIEGRKQYAECVAHCTAPLPSVYIQRPIFAMGLSWFGKSASSCLDCHAKK
jgi:hypothetical protein